MERSDSSLGGHLDCPVELLVNIIGGKWKIPVLWVLDDSGRALRFTQLKARLSNVSPKVFSQVLKELERDGLISRNDYRESPPRVEYELTGLGASLGPLLCQMSDWTHKHLLAEGSPAKPAAEKRRKRGKEN